MFSKLLRMSHVTFVVFWHFILEYGGPEVVNFGKCSRIRPNVTRQSFEHLLAPSHHTQPTRL